MAGRASGLLTSSPAAGSPWPTASFSALAPERQDRLLERSFWAWGLGARGLSAGQKWSERRTLGHAGPNGSGDSGRGKGQKPG